MRACAGWIRRWHTACALVGWMAALAVHPATAEPMSTLVATPTPIVGTLVETQFYSPTLGQAEPYRVYLPPDYATSSRRYPVLYMLHGAGGGYTEWSDSFLPERADDMIRNGLIQPMIVVMPSGGDRTYWANWPGGLRWADSLAYDVVGEIDAHFRTLPTPASRAIGGLSMDRWQPGEHLQIWVDVGLDDGWRPNIEALGANLQAQGIATTWREFPGTHEDTYWTSHVPDYLSFYSSALVSTDAPA